MTSSSLARFSRQLAAPTVVIRAVGLWLLAAGLAAMSAPAARAQAEAAQKPPLAVAVLVSSRKDLCFDPGEVAAIRKLATAEQDRINRQGGIHGRPLRLRFLDDERTDEKALANIRTAIAEPSMLALIGLSNTARAKAVFDALGKDIVASGIPFISDLSLNSLFEKMPNVLTTRASQDDERLPVISALAAEIGALRPAFLGIKGAVFSEALGDGLKRAMVDRPLVADQRLRLANDALDPAQVTAAIGEIREKGADLIFLNVGGARTAALLRQIAAAGSAPPVLVTGRIDNLPKEVTRAYPNDLYQLTWDGLPEVYNDRLRRSISRSLPADWVFEGTKVPEAPGWKSGECKPRPDGDDPNPITAANLRAIGIGTQFADMVGLVAAAAATGDARADVRNLRIHVLDELVSTYAVGRGAFRGSFDNWSFDPKSRAATRTPLIVMQPRGLASTQLAPAQFIRLKANALRRIDTLYLDIDMMRTHRVDDNEKTFYADFYLSMRDSSKASIEQIEFTNAVLDPRTNDRMLTVRVLHGGGKSDVYPDGMRIYQISGKFHFEPQLAAYPFDTQRFSVDIQPKRGDAPFIIQPPPERLRDRQLLADGWDLKEQYVGYDEDFVPMIDARTHAPSIVPYYKASFVWIMKRQTTDYFLRVVVPLGFILLVAYLSIFIPQSHFEAIITLQVTALLSAVALYLSLPKLDADTATVSDRIFLLDYMLVSLMIGISILRVGRWIAGKPWLKSSLAFIHIAGVPLVVAVAAFMIYKASGAEG